MLGNQFAPSEVTWEGDLVPPVTSYASADRPSAPGSNLKEPPSRNVTNSAVVYRRPLRNGLQYFYSWGGVRMPVPSAPTPGAGGVRSSAFQQILVQLHDWSVNTAWYIAYPRNLGYSFRGPQPKTQVTGGPGPGAMLQRPLLPKVQSVPRYSVVPKTYPTRAAKS